MILFLPFFQYGTQLELYLYESEIEIKGPYQQYISSFVRKQIVLFSISGYFKCHPPLLFIIYELLYCRSEPSRLMLASSLYEEHISFNIIWVIVLKLPFDILFCKVSRQFIFPVASAVFEKPQLLKSCSNSLVYFSSVLCVM